MKASDRTDVDDESPEDLRLDELARRAGVASTTVRLYRTKGLLHPPRLEGRVGWYDGSHLARLRLIARLQEDGHSLAGIRDLVDQWEQGRSLAAVIGVETRLDALVDDVRAVDLDPGELVERFPQGSVTPALLQRVAALGLATARPDGRIHVPDERFLGTGAALARLGVPLDVVLDEWEALAALTDTIADRFVDVLDEHLAPQGWRHGLAEPELAELADTLALLQTTAREVVAAALDASLARAARRQLGQLLGRDTES